MDSDAAFSQYAAARWRVLVRAGVLLGCHLAEAEDLAQQVLNHWTPLTVSDFSTGIDARSQGTDTRATR